MENIDRLSRIPNVKKAQQIADSIYGKGEWEVILYNGGHQEVLLEHKCGQEKTVSRFSTFKLGKTKCECQHDRSSVGRPPITFEELAKRVAEVDYGNYELLELISGKEFIVNHKACNRKPIKTSLSRFFSAGQRCACMKPGRQPVKSTEEEK